MFSFVFAAERERQARRGEEGRCFKPIAVCVCVIVCVCLFLLLECERCLLACMFVWFDMFLCVFVCVFVCMWLYVCVFACVSVCFLAKPRVSLSRAHCLFVLVAFYPRTKAKGKAPTPPRRLIIRLSSGLIVIDALISGRRRHPIGRRGSRYFG